MNYPIPESETWYVRDPSKVKGFMDCPRQYFFEYMLGWRSTAPNNDLVFGEAIHDGTEVFYLKGFGTDQIKEAYQTFLTTYRRDFPASTDALFEPKTPAKALKFFSEYTVEYPRDFDNLEVLYTEIAGTVPLNERHLLHFRMDTILRDTRTGLYLSHEHKTSKQKGRTWTDQWFLSTQLGTYSHVLYCLYPYEIVKGITVNGMFFYKDKIGFERVPVHFTKPQMQVWAWNMTHYLDMIDWETQRLAECKDSDDVLECFPMQTENCTKYRGCSYHEYCIAWPNPLQRCQEPPLGFKMEFWDPRARKSRHRIDVGKEVPV
jgi:CRISPR/Cas system-associated exonuclease Cas4 (RecB family)